MEAIPAAPRVPIEGFREMDTLLPPRLPCSGEVLVERLAFALAPFFRRDVCLERARNLAQVLLYATAYEAPEDIRSCLDSFPETGPRYPWRMIGLEGRQLDAAVAACLRVFRRHLKKAT